MLKQTIAALLLTFPAAAQTAPVVITPQADTSITIGVTRGAFGAPGEVDRFTTYLEDGQDYAVGVDGESSRWTVTGPTGALLCDDGANTEHDFGCEWRAGRSGWFTITGTKNDFETTVYPTPYTLRLSVDCKSTAQTRCKIKVGERLARTFTWGGDADAYGLRDLVAGRTYRVTYEGPSRDVYADILDGTGNVLASRFVGLDPLSFKATKATRFVRLRVEDGFGPAQYHLSLTR